MMTPAPIENAKQPGSPPRLSQLTELSDAWRAPSAGERLVEVRRAAPRLRERILESGQVSSVRTFDLSRLPYPTSFGFAGAAISPLPYLVMTNRANLVQFETEDGEKKTLLFNPTDVDRSANTPFFADLRRGMGERLSRWMMATLRRPTVKEHLSGIGVRPEAIDYIAFDHLHTQDLRAILGSSDEGGVSAFFPRAKLLIWRPELEIFRGIHPLQRWWYIPEALRGVPEDRIIAVDGDLLLGRGVALVRTPGHTVGNWSLVLNTESGVWAVSENGIACDAYAPEASSIPGLRRYAARERVEVILNSNTLEGRNEQYTSMVLEKALVDRSRKNPAFYQHQSSSELTATPFTPGLSPTLHHGGIESGTLR
jgi:hypothetical protein